MGGTAWKQEGAGPVKYRWWSEMWLNKQAVNATARNFLVLSLSPLSLKLCNGFPIYHTSLSFKGLLLDNPNPSHTVLLGSVKKTHLSED